MNDEDSIYSPPAADLTIKEALPEQYVNGPLTRKKLVFISWLSLFYLVLEFPLIALSFLSGFSSDSGTLAALETVLDITNTLILVYLMLMFKAFVNSRFNYSGVNTHIMVIIVLSVMLTVYSFLMGEEFGIAMIVFFLLLVPLGIVTILFGKRLLTIKEDYRFLRLYSWSNIIMGILLTTVILFALAIPVSLLADFAFMMIFFTAVKELKAEAAA
jgi:hypothetical protein